MQRILAGTRIETEDGSTEDGSTEDGSTEGFANGDARAAETELAWRLTQRPDHDIGPCTARRWLFRQGNFLDIWPDGTLDEAVRWLEPAFNQALYGAEVRILRRWSRFGELCDVGDELLVEARRRIESGGKLYRCHLVALASFGLISEVQLREWEEGERRKLQRVKGTVDRAGPLSPPSLSTGVITPMAGHHAGWLIPSARARHAIPGDSAIVIIINDSG